MSVGQINNSIPYFSKAIAEGQAGLQVSDAKKTGKQSFSDVLTISKEGMAASNKTPKSKAAIEAKKIADTIKEIERGSRMSPNTLFPGELVPRQIDLGASSGAVKETAGHFDLINSAKADGVITPKEQSAIDSYRLNNMSANQLGRENSEFVQNNRGIINDYMDKITEHYATARDEFDPSHEQSRVFDEISNVEIKNNIESKFYSLLKDDPKTLDLMSQLGIERPTQLNS